jgi:uncharacterized low-complexity protein
MKPTTNRHEDKNMSKKHPSTPIALAIGTAFAAGVAATPVVHADVNPFAVTQLSSGYMLSADEGQCGANRQASEAKCGAEKAAQKITDEAECGANKAMAKPKPVKEAKCGEAKCGNNK